MGEGIAAFLFGLATLAVAHHRDGRVPLAIGAVALTTFWMTGESTMGNPLLLGAAAARRRSSRSLPQLLGAEVAGFVAGTITALVIHPKARESVRVLLFDPRGRRG